AIASPSGIATSADQKNACAIRHQLWATLPSRSYSVHSRPSDCTTPAGFGSAMTGSSFDSVTTIQIATAATQLAIASTGLRVDGRRPRMANRLELKRVLLRWRYARDSRRRHLRSLHCGRYARDSGRRHLRSLPRWRYARYSGLKARSCSVASVRRVRVHLDVGAAVLLAAFRRVVTLHRLVGAVADRSHALLGEPVLVDEVALYRLGALARQAHVHLARAGRVRVARDIDDRVAVRAPEAADL